MKTVLGTALLQGTPSPHGGATGSLAQALRSLPQMALVTPPKKDIVALGKVQRKASGMARCQAPKGLR